MDRENTWPNKQGARVAWTSRAERRTYRRFTNDSGKFEARNCSCPRLCVHGARASPPRGRRRRERRWRGRERFRSRVEVSWCHGNTRRDRERLWPPFPLPTHWRRMRERIVAFEEPCTRLTAAPSKEEENRSFLSHPFPDTHGHLITVKRQHLPSIYWKSDKEYRKKLYWPWRAARFLFKSQLAAVDRENRGVYTNDSWPIYIRFLPSMGNILLKKLCLLIERLRSHKYLCMHVFTRGS